MSNFSRKERKRVNEINFELKILRNEKRVINQRIAELVEERAKIYYNTPPNSTLSYIKSGLESIMKLGTDVEQVKNNAKIIREKKALFDDVLSRFSEIKGNSRKALIKYKLLADRLQGLFKRKEIS